MVSRPKTKEYIAHILYNLLLQIFIINTPFKQKKQIGSLRFKIIAQKLCNLFSTYMQICYSIYLSLFDI